MENYPKYVVATTSYVEKILDITDENILSVISIDNKQEEEKLRDFAGREGHFITELSEFVNQTAEEYYEDSWGNEKSESVDIDKAVNNLLEK